MTKYELATAVAYKTGNNKQMVTEIIDATMVEIKIKLSKSGSVYLRGFGTFSPKIRKAKVGRNISKGTQVDIPERRVPHFKPAQDFKEALK